MWRNILSQSVFQLILLVLLLFLGSSWFDVHEGNYCTKWDMNNGVGPGKVADKGVTCQTVLGLCSNGKSSCFEANFPSLDTEEIGANCADLCEDHDYTHFTIIFNAFVFCQLFNEFNARSIGDEWDVYSDLNANPIFLFIIFVTILTQLFVVEVGGEFTRTTGLSAEHWFITIGLGAISLPVGLLMRLIPVDEDPNAFADNQKVSNKEASQTDIENVVGIVGMMNGEGMELVPMEEEKKEDTL